MRKRSSMNKNIALIIAGAVMIGQLPVQAIATTNEVEVVSQDAAVETMSNSDEDVKPYIQNYDRPEGITWTSLRGSASPSVADGYLSFTNSGECRIMEDQSPEIRNGELESKFIVGGDQTGILFRATASNYGMINYNSKGGWVIENASQWKDISGPVLNVGDVVVVKARFQEKHLTVHVSVNDGEFEKIFDEETDVIPLQAGKVGYRGWGASKTTKYDYIKYAPIAVDHGAVVSINEVNLETFPRVKPNLPSTVTVNYEDGMSGIKEVAWNYISKESYSKPGKFDVEGTIEGTDIKAVAHVTVSSDLKYYEADFETEENSGDWQVVQGSGTPTVQNGAVTVPMNGVATAVDMKSPDVKDFIYETDFTVNSDSGRIGLLFRYTSETEWGALCYDNNAWVWKTGDGKYGGFPGSFALEADQTYRMKLKVEDTNVTLWIDGEKIGQIAVPNLPDVSGKVGLSGWFGNKNVTLDNVMVQELGGLTAPEVGPLEEQTIQSDVMKVVLDNRFPTVVRYEWNGSEDVLKGAPVDDYEAQYLVEVNGDKYIPEVTSTFQNNEGIYTLNFKEIGMTITLKMTVNGNKLRMEVTDIQEGEVKLQTLNFPNHSLASVNSLEGGKTASVLTTGDWNNINEDFTDVAGLRPGAKGKTYAFINNDKFAVTVNNNTVEGGNRIVLTTENDTLEDNTNFKKASLSNGAWTYREVLQSTTDLGEKLFQEEMPWSEVIVTRDDNEDGQVDWQDAAKQYRENMIVSKGGEDIKNNLSRIDFNIAYTQQPFLRSLDTVKKLSNYTDNFGQMVLHKGYQSEGHDDSIPDYGGHIGIRQGGKEDFNTLIEEGKKYNAKIGVHVNATEYTMDAFQYPQNGTVNENAPGWGWVDQAYYVDQRADVTTGELFRRLDMLKADAPDLGWVYVDVYTGNGWNAKQLADKINSLGYTLGTEMNGPLEQQAVWTHWGGDPAYPNKGNASKIMRFIKNDTQDSFLADPLVKGNKHLLSGGWGTRHDIEGEFGVDVFYNQVLPTKYMQHFPITKMSDNEVLFEDGLRASREGSDINYYKNDRLVATTPENSIGSTGIGKTLLFLPWNPVDEANSDKIYHWNPLGTTSEWTLPEGWNNLSTVKVYELSDLGRTFVKDVQVVDGKVNLEVKKDTPYIVTKGEVEESRIDDWGYGAQIQDPGFDSQTWDYWTKSSSSENTDHINLVNENVNKRKGNDVVEIGDKDGKLTQTIDELVPGKTYSVSAWVKNDNKRNVSLKVKSGNVEIENVITSSAERRQGEGVKWIDDTFTRMEVEFTVPTGVKTADIVFEVSEGNAGSKVVVDDFRIWEHPGHTNRDGYVFYEDFENVDEGVTPFFLAPGRGHSNRTHLAEKDISIDANQRMNWVLDGRFSLKTNQQPDEQGQMLITDVSTFKLEKNKTYELGFLYSLADAAPGYTVNIKSKTNGTLLSIPLTTSATAKSVAQEFTTGNVDDYYLSIDKGQGYKELILDNIYVTEIDKSITNAELNYVNFNTMINNLEIGQEVSVHTNGVMNNGKVADLSGATVEYVVSNPEVVSVVDGKMAGVAEGRSNVSVNVTVDGKVVSSNVVQITVGNPGEGEVVVNGNTAITTPEEIKVNTAFDTTIGVNDIKEGLELYAAEFTFTYNPEVFDFNHVSAAKPGLFVTGQKVKDGEIKIIASSLGTAIVNGEEIAKVNLTPKAKATDETLAVTVSRLGDGEGNVHDFELASKNVNVTEDDKPVEIVVNKVQNLSGTATANSVNLTWDAPSTPAGLVEYVIFKDGKEFTRVAAGTTEVTVDGLRANSIYGFKVVAKYSNDKESKPVSLNVRTNKN